MERRNVVFIGKLGHGKTHLVNKLCNTTFPSVMCAESCTRENQFGTSVRHGITIIDTPGFGSSLDTNGHIRAQQDALERQLISGIYAVVKFGAPSDVAECVNHLMNFVGSDDVRIVVTHWDVVCQDDGVDIQAVKEDFSSLLSVPTQHILLVGKDSPASEMEDFVFATLHEPRQFRIENDQVAFAASQTVGARRFKNELDQLQSKLVSANKCIEWLKYRSAVPRSVNVALAAKAVCVAAEKLVGTTTTEIRKRATQELTPEEAQLVEDMIEEGLMMELGKICQASHKMQSIGFGSKKRKMSQGGPRSGCTVGDLKFEFVNESESWRLQCSGNGNIVHIEEFLQMPLLLDRNKEDETRRVLRATHRNDTAIPPGHDSSSSSQSHHPKTSKDGEQQERRTRPRQQEAQQFRWYYYCCCTIGAALFYTATVVGCTLRSGN